jgi:O-antigen/teichoic acid export membrane protein
LFAVQGLLNTALNILFNLLLLLPFSLGVTGYVLSIILADLGATLYVVWRAKLWRAWAPNTVNAPLIRDILRFCIPMIPATVCWWVISVSDRYMVTHFCGDATNGLYTAAYKIPNLLTIAGNIFIEAWQFSAVVENRKRSDLETAWQKATRQRHISAFFGRIFCAYAPLLFILGGIMLMCSELLAGILFDPSFMAAWVYIPILVTATVFSALSNFVGSVYLVKKKPNLSLLTTAIAALINVLLNLALIPGMGAMGAAIATLIAYGALFFIRLGNARRYVPFVCQLPRQIISTLLIVLTAICISPIGNSFLLAVVFFFFLMLNNVNPLIKGIYQRIEQKKRKNL